MSTGQTLTELQSILLSLLTFLFIFVCICYSLSSRPCSSRLLSKCDKRHEKNLTGVQVDDSLSFTSVQNVCYPVTERYEIGLTWLVLNKSWWTSTSLHSLFRCWRRVWLINHFICFLRIRVKQQWCHKSTIPELLSLLLLLIFFKDRHWCSSSIWQTPAGSALHVQIQCSAFSECPFCRFAMKIEQVGYVMCCCNRRKEVVTKQFSQCIYDPICSISTISVRPAAPHLVCQYASVLPAASPAALSWLPYPPYVLSRDWC